MSYKFLLFDLDHTLLDFDAAEDVALTQLLKEEGIADIQAYKDYYVPMNKALWKDLEQKKISKQELVNTRFSRLFAHFGLEKDGSFLAQRYQFYLAQQGQTLSGAHELLDSLIDRDYDLYAATNGITAIRQGVWLSLVWHLISIKSLSLSNCKHKNQMLSFMKKLVNRLLDLVKKKTLMIGDSLTADIQGGNNAGIDTIWYNPHHLETPHKPSQPTSPFLPDLLDCLDKTEKVV